MDDLKAKIEHAIRSSVFVDERSEGVGGIDFAAEAVLEIIKAHPAEPSE